ncbi:MAG: S8 family peptidase [Cyclobacteriaceae bacterium]
MRYRLLGIMVGLLGVSVMTFSQSKLSPKFESNTARATHKLVEKYYLLVEDIDSFVSEFPNVPVLARHKESNAIIISATDISLVELTASNRVLFIDFHRDVLEEAFLEKPNFILNRVRTTQNLRPDLKGENIHVSVKERSIDAADLDVTGRVREVGLGLDEESPHATEMATIIGGAGNSDQSNYGVAPNATLSSSGFDNLLPDDESVFETHSIYIQNHSYGVGIENYYGSEALAYDASVYANPQNLHVFSAGNLGAESPETGDYAGLNVANISGTFKQAKNVLVINAYDSALNVNDLNSMGPAYDGRIKPELAAYGYGGTSDAAALISGAAALFYEHYAHLYDSVPSADLIKAALIAGADDVGTEGINFKTGYGSVNLKKTLTLLDSAWFTRVNILQNEEYTLNLPAFGKAGSLRLAVVWHGPAASINATKALVNDIDAVLTADGENYLPWVLSHYPNPDSLSKPARRSQDHLNNVEFFTADVAAGANVSLKISGAASDQFVSVAYYLNPQDHFQWDYPVGNSLLLKGATEQLVWDQSFDESATLSYRVGDGSWTEIETAANLMSPYFWRVPDISGLAQLRMEISGEIFDSEVFSVSEKPEMTVAFKCTDEVGFIWGKMKGAISYEVFGMGDRYLEKLETVTDTVTKLGTQSLRTYYAVQPVFAGGVGARSTTINANFQGALCYINIFSVNRAHEDVVEVKLALSTIHDIDKIEVYKMHEQDSALWESVAPDFTTDFVFPDYQLEPGFTRYRAYLYFKDGSVLSTEDAGIFLEQDNRAILFPNPIINQDYINILSDGDVLLEILDGSGKILTTKTLFFTVDYIDLYDLESGVYLYRLKRGKKVIDAGRFAKY